MDKYELKVNNSIIKFKKITPSSSKLYDYIKKIKSENDETIGYLVKENIGYYSDRYNEWVIVEKGDKLDGATYAKDITSFSWVFHDELTATNIFYSGKKCSKLQSSLILFDILTDENRFLRSYTWFIATLIYGYLFNINK